MFFQSIEVRGPEPSIGREPLIQFDERLRSNLVKTPLRVSPRHDKASVLQYAQMFRHRGLAQIQVLDKVSYRPLAVAQRVEDRQPAWFRQYLEGSNHDA